MKPTDFIREGIGQDADEMHRDHEVQMARGDCYNAAKYAIELHKMLHHVGEQQGLDGWVSEKITLANDYLRTVWEYLNHEMASDDQPEMPVFSFEAAEQQFSNLLVEGEPGDLEHELEKQEYERDQERDAQAEKEANETIDFDQLRRDAAAGVKSSLDKQSDARIAAAQQPKPGFWQQMGNKQIGMIKGAYKGAKAGLQGKSIGESMSAGGTGVGAVATVVSGTGRPTTGKPKKISNTVKSAKPKFGKGIY